jgi:hypothetical protein
MDSNNLLTIAVVLIIVVVILGDTWPSGDNTDILGLVCCLTLAAVAV